MLFQIILWLAINLKEINYTYNNGYSLSKLQVQVKILFFVIVYYCKCGICMYVLDNIFVAIFILSVWK